MIDRSAIIGGSPVGKALCFSRWLAMLCVDLLIDPFPIPPVQLVYPIAGSSPQMVDDVQVLTMTLSWIIMSICGQLQVPESVGVFFVWFLGWWVGKPWKAILSTQSFHHVHHVPWRIVPATGIHGMILHKQNSAVIPEILLKRCEKLPFFASNSYPKNSGRFAKSLFLVFNPFCCFNAENFPVDITMVCWCQVFLNSSSMKMTQIRSQAHRILRYFCLMFLWSHTTATRAIPRYMI